jgi:uncharacterized protein YjbI with pentapeptide repeats
VGRKKPGRKRSQESQESIWTKLSTALKDHAAVVAAFISIYGLLIGNWLIIAHDTNLARQNQEAQQELEHSKTQDAAIQTYFDQIGQLLLNNDLRSSEADSDQRTLARARTLTVLGRLDPSRKTQVMQFLIEAGLVSSVEGRDPAISLANADLSRANLRRADLSGAQLGQADLSYANLLSADLRGADLRGADLRGADFSGAGLTDAKVTQEQLDQANSLDSATMPDGQKYEDWLKSRGSGEE